MEKYIWKSWIEAPKSADVFNFIKKYCIDNDITIDKLEAISSGKDWIDRIFSINRETIYFNLSGRLENLTRLQNTLYQKYGPEYK